MVLLQEMRLRPKRLDSPGQTQEREGFRIALISDTHGLLRPEAEAFVGGARTIVHGGDIGPEDILVRLRRLAPVIAVRGNNDRAAWAESIRVRECFETGGVGILVIHDRAALRRERLPDGIDVVVSGHSHRPLLQLEQGRLFVNPGSAGPRRFKLPVSVAELIIEAGVVTARLVELGAGAHR